MFDTYITIIKDIVWDSTLLILAGGAFVGLAVGIWLLISPQSMHRLGRSVNQWRSTSGLSETLDRPRFKDHIFYRYHFLFGAAITVGALYCLYYVLFQYDQRSLLAALNGSLDSAVLAWLLDALWILVTVGNVFIVAVGIIVFLRPSLLKRVEAWSNHWVSTQRVEQVLDDPHGQPDNVLARHPRMVGVFIVVGSLYVIVNLTRILF